jgi:hypothetical protein
LFRKDFIEELTTIKSRFIWLFLQPLAFIKNDQFHQFWLPNIFVFLAKNEDKTDCCLLKKAKILSTIREKFQKFYNSSNWPASFLLSSNFHKFPICDISNLVRARSPHIFSGRQSQEENDAEIQQKNSNGRELSDCKAIDYKPVWILCCFCFSSHFILSTISLFFSLASARSLTRGTTQSSRKIMLLKSCASGADAAHKAAQLFFHCRPYKAWQNGRWQSR